MTPDLQIDALADTPSEQRALRKFAVVVGLVFVGIASGVAGAGYAFAFEKRLTAVETEQASVKDNVAATRVLVEMLVEDCYRRGGCKR
jgi:hypothetical protein